MQLTPWRSFERARGSAKEEGVTAKGWGAEAGKVLGARYPCPFSSIQPFFRFFHFSKGPSSLKPISSLRDLIQDVLKFASGPVHISTENFWKEGKKEGGREGGGKERKTEKDHPGTSSV